MWSGGLRTGTVSDAGGEQAGWVHRETGRE